MEWQDNRVVRQLCCCFGRRKSTRRQYLLFVLEVCQKEVECTFGILKGRFRVLKTGIRLGGQQAGDWTFLTCWALHNWLLEVDGLDKGWEEGVASMWEGNLGLHDASDVHDHLPVPLQRMLSPTGLWRYDATSEIDRTAHVNNAFILNEQIYAP